MNRESSGFNWEIGKLLIFQLVQIGLSTHCNNNKNITQSEDDLWNMLALVLQLQFYISFWSILISRFKEIAYKSTQRKLVHAHQEKNIYFSFITQYRKSNSKTNVF